MWGASRVPQENKSLPVIAKKERAIDQV